MLIFFLILPCLTSTIKQLQEKLRNQVMDLPIPPYEEPPKEFISNTKLSDMVGSTQFGYWKLNETNFPPLPDLDLLRKSVKDIPKTTERRVTLGQKIKGLESIDLKSKFDGKKMSLQSLDFEDVQPSLDFKSYHPSNYLISPAHYDPFAASSFISSSTKTNPTRFRRWYRDD